MHESKHVFPGQFAHSDLVLPVLLLLDMHESKHVLPGQFVHSDLVLPVLLLLDMHESKHVLPGQFVHSDLVLPVLLFFWFTNISLYSVHVIRCSYTRYIILYDYLFV